MNLARHYRTLGLRPGSSAREIKAAYRQLVRQYHPDINPDKQAVEHFIKINDAYTAISAALQRTTRKKQPHTGRAHTGRAQHKTSTAKKTDTQSTTTTQPANTSSTRSQPPLNLDRLDIDSLKLQLEELGIGNFSHSQETATSHSNGYTAFRHTASNSGSPNGKGEPNASDTNEQASQHTTRSEGIDTEGTNSEATDISHDISLKQDAYSQLKKLLKHQKYPRAVALVEGLAHRMPTDTEISQWQAIVYQRWGRLLIDQGQHHKASIYLKKALRTDPNNPSLWSEVNRDFWHLNQLEGNLPFQSNLDAVSSQPKPIQ